MAVDSRPSTADEKDTILEDKPKGFFFKRKSAKVPEANDDGKDVNITTEVEPVVPPVSLTQLFRSVQSLGAFWIQSSFTPPPGTPQNSSFF